MEEQENKETREIDYTQATIYFPLSSLSDIDDEAQKEEMSRSAFIRYLFKFYKRRKGLKGELKAIKKGIKEIKVKIKEG